MGSSIDWRKRKPNDTVTDPGAFLIPNVWLNLDRNDLSSSSMFAPIKEIKEKNTKQNIEMKFCFHDNVSISKCYRISKCLVTYIQIKNEN